MYSWHSDHYSVVEHHGGDEGGVPGAERRPERQDSLRHVHGHLPLPRQDRRHHRLRQGGARQGAHGAARRVRSSAIATNSH